MKPNIKKQTIAGLLMSGVMSIVLAGFFTWMDLGFSSTWLWAWLSGVLIGWPIAFVLAAVVAEPIRKLAERIAGP